MTGPADDPHDRPTGIAEVAVADTQVLEHAPVPATEDAAPRAWYHNRILLALWTLILALLLTLIVYGIVELSRGGSTSGPASTTSSTTTPSRSSTTSPTTTPPTTTEDTSPPESPEETQEAPPPANNAPAPAEPPHHHHHPHIPSTIQLPHTVITVPHGF